MPRLRRPPLLVLACLLAALACRGPAPEPTPRVAGKSETPALPPAIAPASPVTAPAAGTGRVRVAETEGQGANLRVEPGTGAPRVKTLREGAELEVVGPDREADGRGWRNVRDPADGASGRVAAEFVAPARRCGHRAGRGLTMGAGPSMATPGGRSADAGRVRGVGSHRPSARGP